MKLLSPSLFSSLQFFISLILVLSVLNGCVGPIAARAEPNDKLPVLLYASWCPICHEAKAYLEENGVTFELVDIETSARGKALFQQSGALGPPVLFVCGEFYRGFGKRAWKKALAESCRKGNDNQYALSRY